MKVKLTVIALLLTASSYYGICNAAAKSDLLARDTRFVSASSVDSHSSLHSMNDGSIGLLVKSSSEDSVGDHDYAAFLGEGYTAPLTIGTIDLDKRDDGSIGLLVKSSSDDSVGDHDYAAFLGEDYTAPLTIGTIDLDKRDEENIIARRAIDAGTHTGSLTTIWDAIGQHEGARYPNIAAAYLYAKMALSDPRQLINKLCISDGITYKIKKVYIKKFESKEIPLSYYITLSCTPENAHGCCASTQELPLWMVEKDATIPGNRCVIL